MPIYRVTIRHGAPRVLYEVLDVDASDLRGALLAAAQRMHEDVAATADLAEIRVQVDPDEREYAPG